MFIGSIVAFKVTWAKSQKVLCITQHLSAGLLIAAIGEELMPRLFENPHGWANTLAIMIGFFLGVGIMLVLEHFLDGDDDKSEADTEQGKSNASRAVSKVVASAEQDK